MTLQRRGLRFFHKNYGEHHAAIRGCGLLHILPSSFRRPRLDWLEALRERASGEEVAFSVSRDSARERDHYGLGGGVRREGLLYCIFKDNVSHSRIPDCLIDGIVLRGCQFVLSGLAFVGVDLTCHFARAATGQPNLFALHVLTCVPGLAYNLLILFCELEARRAEMESTLDMAWRVSCVLCNLPHSHLLFSDSCMSRNWVSRAKQKDTVSRTPHAS